MTAAQKIRLILRELEVITCPFYLLFQFRQLVFDTRSITVFEFTLRRFAVILQSPYRLIELQMEGSIG